MSTRPMMTAALLLLSAGAAGYTFQTPTPQMGVDPRPPNGATQAPAFPGQTDAPEKKTTVAFDVVTFAEGLDKPWGLTFLPSGKILVTEKPSRLRVVGKDGTLSPAVTGLPAVDARGQGGLLDVLLDRQFASNQLIYWSYSEPAENQMNNTAVARGKFVDGAEPRIENVQGNYHQGLRLPRRSTTAAGWSGPATHAFITQGDASITLGRMQAQNMDSLIGAIVRINADGTIPKDNPFVGKASARTVDRPSQRPGATLHPTTGELWEVEHGTRGGDDQHLAQGQRLRLADDRGNRIPSRRSPGTSRRNRY